MNNPNEHNLFPTKHSVITVINVPRSGTNSTDPTHLAGELMLGRGRNEEPGTKRRGDGAHRGRARKHHRVAATGDDVEWPDGYPVPHVPQDPNNPGVTNMLHLGYVTELKDDFARLSPSTRYEYFRIGVKADKWARARVKKGEIKEYGHETKKYYPKRRWNKALVAEYLGRGLDTDVEGSIRSMQKKKKTTLEKAQPGGATVGGSTINKVHAALLFM
jgi:hypothetical protein